jgi:hypothetical protein
MNLHQDVLTQMNQPQKVRFMNKLRDQIGKRLFLKQVSDFDLLAYVTQEEYNTAVRETGVGYEE